MRLLFLLFILSFGNSIHGQTRFSADSYLASPEKYLGKTVTIYVDSVDVPAINSSTDDGFRVFHVSTKGRNGNDYMYGGSIYVKVPRQEAEAFANRHNNPNKMGPKNMSGTFTEWPSEYKRTMGDNPSLEQVWRTRCYSYSRYYIDCTK